MNVPLCLLQTWPSNVVLNWVRAIGHFNASDTTPLNITTIDTAEIRSTLQVSLSAARDLASTVRLRHSVVAEHITSSRSNWRSAAKAQDMIN